MKARAAALEADAGPQGSVYHLHPNDHDRFEKQHWYELMCQATETTLQRADHQPPAKTAAPSARCP